MSASNLREAAYRLLKKVDEVETDIAADRDEHGDRHRDLHRALLGLTAIIREILEEI